MLRMSPMTEMRTRLRPLAQCPRETLAAIRGVLTDIDETVSTDGRLTAEAYGALEALKKAGLPRDPGDRPAGRLVRPHRALLAGRCGGRRERRLLDVARRQGAQAAHALRAVRGRARRRPAPAGRRARPGAARGAGRRHRLGPALSRGRPRDRFLRGRAAAAARRGRRASSAIFERHGAHAKVSSIHVNGWFGDYDKLTTSRR